MDSRLRGNDEKGGFPPFPSRMREGEQVRKWSLAVKAGYRHCERRCSRRRYCPTCPISDLPCAMDQRLSSHRRLCLACSLIDARQAPMCRVVVASPAHDGRAPLIHAPTPPTRDRFVVGAFPVRGKCKRPGNPVYTVNFDRRVALRCYQSGRLSRRNPRAVRRARHDGAGRLRYGLHVGPIDPRSIGTAKIFIPSRP